VSARLAVDIEPARRGDLESIHELLLANHLPVDDLDRHVDSAFIARQDGRVVGAAALEVYGDGGLLRSVVVAAEHRGTGLGQRLVDAVMQLARSKHLPAVYLLTTTAASYFPRMGFVPISRDRVPAGVQQSVGFVSACCASAAVLMKQL
jgi:amino-acid N-acetyltransferase